LRIFRPSFIAKSPIRKVGHFYIDFIKHLVTPNEMDLKIFNATN
jgi:hypothetical protein